jgi:hypothetical protein
MKKEMIILMLLMVSFSIVGAQTDFEIYYKLNLDYSYGNISISSTEIEFSQERIKNPFGFYVVKVLDHNGEILNITFFDVPNEILYDTIDPETEEISGGGLLELNKTSFEIFVPYYENAKDIVIYDENLSELTRKDIGEYSRQREIISGEVVKDKEKIIDGERKISETESLIDKISKYWWILLIILVVLVIVLFYSLSKKK